MERPPPSLYFLSGDLLAHDINRYTLIVASLQMKPAEFLIKSRGELGVEVPGLSV